MKKALLLALLLLAFTVKSNAQVGVQLSAEPKQQFFDDDGNPLAGGKLCTYISGSNTPQATYTDFMGTVQNTNPVILDIAGRAQIWYDTTKDYRVVLRTAGTTSNCSDGTILWTVDGVQTSSLTTVGNLPPLFTSTVLGGSVTFTLTPVGAGKIFGNFTGGTAAPTFGAPGSDKQILYNNGGSAVGASQDLTFDNTLKQLTLSVGGARIVQLLSSAGAGKILFGTGSGPFIVDNSGTGWFLTAATNQDMRIGPQNSPDNLLLASGPAGDSMLPLGYLRLGSGASNGVLYLNDGSSAMSFAGAKIFMGFQANPNGVIAAETGSIFLTTAGGAATTLWVKETSPTTTTGWVGK